MEKFTIVVILDGQTLEAISDGTESGTTLTGSENHVRQVRKAIRLGTLVDMVETRRSPPVRSGYENQLALAAALYSIMPSYTRLLEAPAEVLEFFRWNLDENNDSSVIITVD